MGVGSELGHVRYLGDGSASVFPFPYKFFKKEDVRVVREDPNGARTVLALGTDYTIPDSAVGAKEGGPVTLTAGALAAGWKLLIRRRLALKQETDLRHAGPYLAEEVENQFDREAMTSQQLYEEISRCLRLPETEDGLEATTLLPTFAQRRNKYLAWNADGNPVAAGDPGGLPPTILEWAFAGTLSLDQNGNLFEREIFRPTEVRYWWGRLKFAPTGGATVGRFLKNGALITDVSIAAGQKSGQVDLLTSFVPGDILGFEMQAVAPTYPGATALWGGRPT
ncbi:MAG TPA: hypothetical protein VFT32_13100 [Candidatus Eisenbacteria bacterium]|nr:hypothetical protein [Candidatus Eisenbacteria bacterium]